MSGRGYVFAAFGMLLALGAGLGWFQGMSTAQILVYALALLVLSLSGILGELRVLGNDVVGVRWKLSLFFAALSICGIANLIWPVRAGSYLVGGILLAGSLCYFCYAVYSAPRKT